MFERYVAILVFAYFWRKKITVSLVEVKEEKGSHKKGSLASEHAFYYHEDHFYILFTLM